MDEESKQMIEKTDKLLRQSKNLREDILLRKFLKENPSYPDYEDPTIIAYDKNGKGYSAKDLRGKEFEYLKIIEDNV